MTDGDTVRTSTEKGFTHAGTGTYLGQAAGNDMPAIIDFRTRRGKAIDLFGFAGWTKITARRNSGIQIQAEEDTEILPEKTEYLFFSQRFNAVVDDKRILPDLQVEEAEPEMGTEQCAAGPILVFTDQEHATEMFPHEIDSHIVTGQTSGNIRHRGQLLPADHTYFRLPASLDDGGRTGDEEQGDTKV